MTALLDIYRTQFRTTVALHLQYRIALLIWLIGFVLEPVVYLVVWSAVARANGGSVAAYSPVDFAAYFLLTMMVNHATFDWHMWEFDYRIRNGSLSPLLLRPLHPIHADIVDNLSYKMLTLPVMLPTAALLFALFGPEFRTPAWALALFVPALLLALAVRFLFEWTLALAAFWTTRITAINNGYFAVFIFFSGQMAPLPLLPAPVRTAAAYLPFRWMISFPIELALGHLSPEEAAQGLAMQALWLCAGLLLLGIVWRAGVRRYAGVGA